MSNGENGEEITLKYGVDVYAEGAFDPQTSTYSRLYYQYGAGVDAFPVADGTASQINSGTLKL